VDERELVGLSLLRRKTVVCDQNKSGNTSQGEKLRAKARARRRSDWKWEGFGTSLVAIVCHVKSEV
jgi:hypothetical protein